MKLLPLLLLYVVSYAATQVAAKAVFAHFMVGNTANYKTSDWEDDINKAQEAHIDAFALNIANNESMNDASISAVFSVAQTKGFKLFFSFDYAGQGPWAKDTVAGLISKWAPNPAYYRYQGRPFVSTFEGPDQANDWISIKASTGCFFVPDWSSLGAAAAMQACGGCADGLFNWAAWAVGPQDMDDYIDASYHDFLGGKPYMMPVSPWFYTNMPGYSKNWLWRGDHTWYDRWTQVNFRQPEWVEIISWNDYGESHHIGPLRDHAMDAFKVGMAPYNYALQHDGWRSTLPFSIDLYKNNIATVDTEGLSFWYRLHPAAACTTGGTTGNTASQLQYEWEPHSILLDSVFFSALLTSEADIEVTVGGTRVPAYWRNKPAGGVGMYHGYTDAGSHTGAVEIKLHRGSDIIAQVTGEAISASCTNNINNYNAWVGSQFTKRIPPVSTPSLSTQVCVEGWAVPAFYKLCEYACSLGYCPPGACVCRAMGPQPERPKWTGVNGYPNEGLSPSYGGLCSFDCGFGYCPSEFCGTTQHELVEPRVSPFLPSTCASGTAEGAYQALCSFTCSHGYCPIAVCKCLSTGPLNLLNPSMKSTATPWPGLGDDHGLCAFACARGNCLSDVCDSTGGLAQPVTSPTPDLSIPHLGEDCYRFAACRKVDEPTSWSCGDGYVSMGHDLDDCTGYGAGWGRPICCKSNDLPMECKWRGGGPECNGQCHAGEITLFKSGHGGQPTDGDGKQCNRGYKFFCCTLRTFNDLTDRCYWTGCGGSCAAQEQEVAYAYNLKDCTVFKNGQRYCCKDAARPLNNCHWVGQGDCADNTCSNSEVTLIVDPGGDSYSTCLWGRSKALCCTQDDGVLQAPTCNVPVCASKVSDPNWFDCDIDYWADDFSNEDFCDENPDLPSKRSNASVSVLDVRSVLEPLGGSKRSYEVDWTYLALGWQIIAYSRRYPGSTHLHDRTRSTPSISLAFRMRDGCTSTDIITVDSTTLGRVERDAEWDTDHNPDLQYVRDFAYTLGTGILPDGSRTTNNNLVAGQDIEHYWNAKVLRSDLPRAGSSQCVRTPNDYFMDRFGSQGNRYPLMLCERNLNQMKGRLFNLDQTGQAPTRPVGDVQFGDLLRQTLRGNITAQNDMFEHLRVVIAVFRYINHPDALAIIQHNRRELQAAADTISTEIGAFRLVGTVHREFNINWYRHAADLARTWVSGSLMNITIAFNMLANGNPVLLPPNWRQVNATISEIWDQLDFIQPPPDP